MNLEGIILFCANWIFSPSWILQYFLFIESLTTVKFDFLELSKQWGLGEQISVECVFYEFASEVIFTISISQ